MDPCQQGRLLQHVILTLNTMRKNEEFCDLIFELNSSQVSAHQLIIAAWSPPIKNLLQLPSASIQHIQVEYDEPEVFQQFITLLYTGTFPEQAANIPAFLLLAATFQIHLLTDLCVEHLKSRTTVDNVLSMFVLAFKYQLSDLETHCTEFLQQHLTTVAEKQELQQLSSAQLHFLLQSDSLSSFSPEMKLFLVMSWLNEDLSHRKKFLIPLLADVDWSEVGRDFLRNIIQTETFFTSNPSFLYLLLHSLHSSSISLEPYENQFLMLQQKYSHLLNNTVTLSPEKPEQVEPLSFSFVSSQTKEHIVFEQNMNSNNNVVIKREPHSSVNLDKVETPTSQDNTSLYIDEADITSSPDIHISRPDSSCDTTSDKIYDNHLSLNRDSAIQEGSSLASILSTLAEGRMKRKCFRSRRTFADPNNKVNGEREAKKCKRKRSVRKQGNMKGRSRLFARKVAESSDTSLHIKEMTKRDIVQLETASEKMTEDVKREDIRGSKGKTERQTADGNLYKGRKITQKTFVKISGASETRKTSRNIKQKFVSFNPKKETKKSKDFKLQMYQCLDCEFTTLNRLSLGKHQKQVHESNCLFCCNLCSFTTKWNKKYYEHMENSHFPGPPHHCDHKECDYSTEKLQELLTHRKQHSDQRPFVCDVCMTAFRNKNNLYQHFKIHSEEKKFQCLECGRCFRLKNTLEQHMVTHSDVRPYLCDLCGFSTKFQSHLISHKRIHSGDVFHCTSAGCTYSTPKMSQLKSHMRSHLGIRCHVCGICGKAFVEKSHLVRHERTHSSERPHTCKDCEYTSTRADKLREHIRKHHSQEGSRAKAAASASKKVSGKAKKSVFSDTSYQCQDEIAMLASNPNSLIEVVVMKNRRKDLRPGNEVDEVTAPGIVVGDDDINTRLEQSVVTTVGAAPSLFTAAENISTNELARAVKNDRELSTVEVLARMSLPMSDITGNAVGYPVQTGVIGTVGDVTSCNLTTQGSRTENKTATRDSISDGYLQQTEPTVPGYTVSDASLQFDHAVSSHQHSFQSGHAYLLMLPSTAPPLQFYHLGQQLDEQKQQNQETKQSTSFSNVGSYLY